MQLDDNTLADVRHSIAVAAGDGARVVVAMSGGVDSSVCAGLVAAAGYETIGVTLQLYDHGEAVAAGRTCCAGADIRDARRVASDLGIAHYVLDYESRFRSEVMEHFAASYARGETPIPCVECNRTVKFRDLMARARELGAACLVTGHYIDQRVNPNGGRDLVIPADMNRDQSYFLYATTREQANYLRFPLGRIDKARTRALARSMGLAVADKPDSQDICFVPGGRYRDVVERLRPDAAIPGDIVHIDGRVLGRHEGVINFTVGQRRGLRIGGAQALYVVAIDAERAIVHVGPASALAVDKVHLRDLNWLGTKREYAAAGEEGLAVWTRVRSTRPPVPATLRIDDTGRATVRLDAPDRGVSPGQACVLYEGPGVGARMLGGGVIASSATSAGMRESAA